MNNGFVLLSRELLESDVFASQKLLKIWIWCLLKANFKNKAVPLKVGKGERIVKVKRSQFLFGRFKAEEELFIDGSTIYKSMKKLEEMEMINIDSNNQYSLITICNYDYYQDAEKYKKQPSNSQVTADEQPSNTTKNAKKGKEGKEEENINKDFSKSKLKTKKKSKAGIKDVKDFYDSELENNPEGKEIGNYERFVKMLFGGNITEKPLEGVLSIKNQVTYTQFEKLCLMKDEISITGLVENMDNTDAYKRYSNLSATLKNWINRNKK